MGNAASVQADQFEKLKAEFESKKDTLSDEQLFNHMKTYYESLTSASASDPAPAASEATQSETPSQPTEGAAAESPP